MLFVVVIAAAAVVVIVVVVVVFVFVTVVAAVVFVVVVVFFVVVVVVVFKCDTLTSSFFVKFSSNLHILIFNVLLCMDFQTSILGLYLISNIAAKNNGKPLKTKFEKIEKQNVDFLYSALSRLNMLTRGNTVSLCMCNCLCLSE